MPFKSEAQRKYLWANEPEIARDWTDTYGSRIQKDDGGIMRRRYFSGAYGQGAGDRGGDPRASAAENRAVGSGAANEAWSPGIQHSGSPLPKKTITTTPDRFPDRGIRDINYGGINVPPKLGPQGNWQKFVAKMRGWNEEENRANTQQEYEDARQNRRDQSSIDRIRKTKGLYDTGVIKRDWDQSPLKDRLAGLEKGQWDRMSAMGMPTDTVYPGEGSGMEVANTELSPALQNAIAKGTSYDEWDRIPMDKYKGLNIQRNYMGNEFTPTIKNIGLTGKQKELLDQRKGMLGALGSQEILDTITSEDDPNDPATLQDVKGYYDLAQGGLANLWPR